MTIPRTLSHDWYRRYLPDNVDIGERSWLHSTLALRHFHSERPRGLRIGADVGLYEGTFFDVGPRGEIDIGDFTMMVGAVISTRVRVTIGSHVLVSSQVVIADAWDAVPHAARHARVHGVRHAPASVVIGAGAWIGTRAMVVGAEVGEGAIVGAGAVVLTHIPPYAVAAGVPARIVGWARPEGPGVPEGIE